MNTELIDSLPAVIERTGIETNLAVARSIITDSIKEAIRLNDTFTSATGLKFKGAAASKLDKELQAFTPRNLKDPIQRIGFMNEQVESLISTVDKMIRREIPTRVGKHDLTYRQVAVIKLVRDIWLFADYSIALISYVSAMETAEAYKIPVRNILNPYAIEYIEKTWLPYRDACTNLVKNGKNIEKTVNTVADITISGIDHDTAVNVHGGDKIDPFRFGFIGTKFNPIKNWLMARAQDRAKRYHCAQEEVRLFEVQLKMIEQVQQKGGKLDPALSQRSKELTGMVEELRSEIAELESYYD